MGTREPHAQEAGSSIQSRQLPSQPSARPGSPNQTPCTTCSSMPADTHLPPCLKQASAAYGSRSHFTGPAEPGACCSVWVAGARVVCWQHRGGERRWWQRLQHRLGWKWPACALLKGPLSAKLPALFLAQPDWLANQVLARTDLLPSCFSVHHPATGARPCTSWLLRLPSLCFLPTFPWPLPVPQGCGESAV